MRLPMVVVVSVVCAACDAAGGPSYGPPATVAKSAGDAAQATVGQAVTPAPAVRVTDDQSRAVPGVAVTFAVASGGGSLTGGSPSTNAEGVATVGSWTLGTVAGANTLSASVAGLSPVTFTATGVAGPVFSIAKESTDGFEAHLGAAVSPRPAVRLKDSFGNDVAGASVTFAVASGGGSATGTTPTTDASGVATVGSWTLGSSAGANTMTASAGSLTPVTFTMSAVDMCARTTDYTLGSSVPGALSATDCILSTGHYADKFTIVTNGLTTFRLDQKSTSVDSRLVLFSQPENRLVQAGPIGMDASMSYIMGAGSIIVGASSTNTGGTGAYTLESTALPESVDNCATYVLVNFPTTTQTVTSTDCADNTASGTYYLDAFVFFVQQGQSYCVSMTTSAFNPYIEVQTLAGSATNSAFATGSGTRTARSTVTPSGTEHRYILASTYNFMQTGAYTLSVALGTCSSSITAESANSSVQSASRSNRSGRSLSRVLGRFKSEPK